MDRDTLSALRLINGKLAAAMIDFEYDLKTLLAENDPIVWMRKGKFYRGNVKCISGDSIYASSTSLSRPMWITVDEVIQAAAYLQTRSASIYTEDGTLLVNGQSV